ncbi:hypothetical protein [Acidisphaera sp. L21]|jgi:hypothetical protein|uniref:hypothetical protein n=1 Tax=Acidisphaera sp. L21 TaxID=1641851 RepID=UPI00131B840D|nr:hypothetical protein [Acidisphaera sp. L21]
MKRTTLLAVTLACGALVATGAQAQRRGRGSTPEDALPPSVPPAVSTLAPTRGIAGPRLQVGAVICASEQDLQNRAVVSRKISDGATDAGDPMAGCRMLNQERGVDILARHGLGRTQVKIKPSGEAGWTDSYFPQ